MHIAIIPLVGCNFTRLQLAANSCNKVYIYLILRVENECLVHIGALPVNLNAVILERNKMFTHYQTSILSLPTQSTE